MSFLPSQRNGFCRSKQVLLISQVALQGKMDKEDTVFYECISIITTRSYNQVVSFYPLELRLMQCLLLNDQSCGEGNQTRSLGSISYENTLKS